MNPADITEAAEIIQECYNGIRELRAVVLPQTNHLLRIIENHDDTIRSLNDEVRSLNILVQQLRQNPQPQASVPPPPPVQGAGADNALPPRVPWPMSPARLAPAPCAPQSPPARVDPSSEPGPLSPTTRRLFEELTEIKDYQDRMKQRHSDLECSKSVILSGIGLTEHLQTRNNQHRNPGRLVPEVKRALSHYGLEELTYNADK